MKKNNLRNILALLPYKEHIVVSNSSTGEIVYSGENIAFRFCKKTSFYGRCKVLDIVGDSKVIDDKTIFVTLIGIIVPDAK